MLKVCSLNKPTAAQPTALPLPHPCPHPPTRWGLDRVFGRRHSHVVIVEDDMLFSPGGWLAGCACCGRIVVCGGCCRGCVENTAGVRPPPSFKRQHTRCCTLTAPADFLLYFEATAPLLDSDPTLWCGHRDRKPQHSLSCTLPATSLNGPEALLEAQPLPPACCCCQVCVLLERQRLCDGARVGRAPPVPHLLLPG